MQILFKGPASARQTRGRPGACW